MLGIVRRIAERGNKEARALFYTKASELEDDWLPCCIALEDILILEKEAELLYIAHLYGALPLNESDSDKIRYIIEEANKFIVVLILLPLIPYE